VSTAWISLALIAGALVLIGRRTWRRLEARAHVARLLADSRSVFEGLTLADLTDPDEKLRNAIADLELRESALRGEAAAELDRHYALVKHITDTDHPHAQPGACLACEPEASSCREFTERRAKAVEVEALERMYAAPAYEPGRGE